MRVGFNAWHYRPKTLGGGETYLLNLLTTLNRTDSEIELIVFTTPLNHALLTDLGMNCICYPVLAQHRAVSILWEQTLLPYLCRRHSIDILHTSANIGLLFPTCPVVLTLHDMFFTRFPKSLRSRILRTIVPVAARRSAHVITDSQTSRNQVLEGIGLSQESVSVVYLAADDRYFRPFDSDKSGAQIALSHGLGTDFILYVGSGAPHKNIKGLIAAFSLLEAGFPDYKLGIVGDMGDQLEELRASATSEGVSRKVIFTGRVSNENLRGIYKAASVFVFPSFYEGFGLPVIEAMASGVPVITSDRSCLPEICADAALLVDPCQPPRLAKAIERVLSDESLRTSLASRGKARAKDFSWHAVAKETLAIYEKVWAQTR